MKRKTLVLGASENPNRYSYRAVLSLLQHEEEVVAIGLKAGEINGVKIQIGTPPIENVDTITLYIGPKNQPEYYDFIFSLMPKRIIFNPGTENQTFEKMAEEKGIEVLNACTLVMLSIGNY